MTISGQKPRIFISYARSDGEAIAKELRRRIEQYFTLWQDRTELEGGKDWWQQIVEALGHVEYLVLVMTPAALQSPIVRKEWRLARQKGVCVIPVMGTQSLNLGSLPRWMRDAHFVSPDVPEEWTRLVRTLESPCNTPRMPFMVEDLSEDFVPRPKEFDALINALLDSTREEPIAITAALRGAGGYGKTTLARALCHNERIQEAFDDGILWITLGEQPGDLTPRVQDLIETLSGERPGFATVEAATARLAQLLSDRDLLIVIDDVWQAGHLKPFLQGGSRCARLITTRNIDTLPALTKTLNVDAMQPAEAVALLQAGLSSEEHAAFHTLARRLGEWPLLLKLVNGVLRKRVDHHGQSLASALATVQQTLDRRGVSAFDARNVLERHQAVTKTIDMSMSLLSQEERQRYGELAIFPEDINVPLATVARLWNATGNLDEFATEDLCLRLSELSLLLELDLTRQRLRMHDVLRTYLQEQQSAQLPNLHQQFLETYKVDGWSEVHLHDTYLYTYLLYHLVQAGRRTELKALLLDFDWLWAKLEATHVIHLLTDFAWITEDTSVRALHDALSRSAHIIAHDKSQLAGQILGRLLHSEDPNLQPLLLNARRWMNQPWMRPLSPSLLRPDPMWDETHDGPVRAIAITPDGRFAVSSSLKVWDVATGEVKRVLIRPYRYPRAVTGDELIISEYSEDTLAVWHLRTGQLLEPLILHGMRRGVWSVAVTSDGRYAACSSDDESIVWNLTTGQIIGTIPVGYVRTLAVTPNGRIVVARHHEALDIFDAKRDKVVGILHNPTGRDILSLTPDASRALSALPEGNIMVWNLSTHQIEQTLIGHTDSVRAVTVASDGKQAVSISRDGTLRHWDLIAGLLLQTFAIDEADLCWPLAMSSENQRVIIGSYRSPHVVVRDLVSGEVTFKYFEGHASEGRVSVVTAVAVTPDGMRAISGAMDGGLRIWDLRTGQIMQAINPRCGGITGIVILAGGEAALISTYDGTLMSWKFSEEKAQILTRYAGTVWDLAVTPDGQRAISALDDHTLQVYEVARGNGEPLLGHTDWVSAVVVMPDNRHVISASGDQTLKEWDLATGQVTRTLTGHSGTVTAVAVTADGKQAVSASRDETLKLWDLGKGSVVATFSTDSPNLCCAIAALGPTYIVGDELGRVHFLRLEGIQ